MIYPDFCLQELDKLNIIINLTDKTAITLIFLFQFVFLNRESNVVAKQRRYEKNVLFEIAVYYIYIYLNISA